MKARASTFFVGLLAIPLLLASCATQPELRDASPPGETGLAEVAPLAESDPEGLIEKLADWSSYGFLDGEGERAKATALASQASGRLVSLFSSAVANRNWDEALRLRSSLSAVSGLTGGLFEEASAQALIALSGLSPAAILLGRAEQYREKGLYAPAISSFFLALSSEGGSSVLDAAAKASWLAFIGKVGDVAAAGQFPAEQEGAPQAGVGGVGLEAAAKAVVTVYVDKGLKIENGVGYPDRVLGSAFQIDPAGYYLTNYHVIRTEVDPSYEGYSRLSIRPADRPETRVPAKVVGWNKALDLALVKASATSPASIFLQGAATVEKGAKVFALGSPVGLENSMSSGIVSASGRRVLERGEALQIDAPVNPGNSGGPLLTEDGRLAGIVFAGLTDYQGLNFALPTAWIDTVAVRLFDGGEVSTPSLGLAAAKDLDGGLSVSYVFPGTPGFKPGDLIVSIDGELVTGLDQAQRVLMSKAMGSLCLIGIERDGKALLVPRKMTALPEGGLKQAAKEDTAENLFSGAVGLMVEHFDGPRGQGGSYKVLKAWPGMAGDEAGISEGDNIVLLRVAVDQKTASLSFDLQLKAPSKGYLEKAMRLALPMEMDNFL